MNNKNAFLLSPLVLALAACGGGADDASLPASVANAATKPAFTCASPATSSASGGSGQITVDTPSTDGSRMYPAAAKFPVAITTRAGSADTLKWTIADALG